jgi:hypothetical protein
MPPDPRPPAHLSADQRVEALRAELTVARHKTRRSLTALQTEVRADLFDLRKLPALLQGHQACLVGAALVAGFLYGNRR